jgi:hypothetical protein
VNTAACGRLFTLLGCEQFEHWPIRRLTSCCCPIAGEEFQAVASGIAELRLFNNKITAIDSRAFRGMSALTSLQVNDNQLKRIAKGLLEDAERLEILYGRATLHILMLGVGAAVVNDVIAMASFAHSRTMSALAAICRPIGLPR